MPHSYVKLYFHLACSNNGPLALQITVQYNSALSSIPSCRKPYPFSQRKETAFQYYTTGQQGNESLLLLRCVTLQCFTHMHCTSQLPRNRSLYSSCFTNFFILKLVYSHSLVVQPYQLAEQFQFGKRNPIHLLMIAGV